MIYRCEKCAFLDFSSLWGSWFRLAGSHLPLTDFSQLWKCSVMQSNFSSSFFFFHVLYFISPNCVWQFCLQFFTCVTLGCVSPFPALKWKLKARSHLTSVQSLFLPSLTLCQESLQDPLVLLEFQLPTCLGNALLLVTVYLLPCSSAVLLDLLISILHLTCQSCSLLLVSLGLHFHFLSLKDILSVNKFLNYICEVILFSFFPDWPEVSSVIALWHHFRLSVLILGMLFERTALREQKKVTPTLWFLKPGSFRTGSLPVIHHNQAVTLVWKFQMTVREFCVYILWRCIWTVAVPTSEIGLEAALPNSLINSFSLFGTFSL